ncbi:YeeE/YedE thiosulfate transporter family protein [Verrucomicrobiota bacterium]
MQDSRLRPYICGALAGLLAVLSVFMSTRLIGTPKYLGASTSFVRVAGLIERAVAPEHVAQNEYYQDKKVRVDWQMMLVAGILIGALISSMQTGTIEFEHVPPIWQERFGKSWVKRAVFAFLGGIILLFGARMAGGCPSGHGLSGMMQLSVSGFITLVCFFGAGVLVANLIYRR